MARRIQTRTAGPALAALLGLSALAHIACRPARGDGPGTLELVLVAPRQSEGVFLNESLDLHFSRPLDSASVTHGITIRDEEGRPAKGTLEVEDDQVRFLPDPVLAGDLSDGGFRPDTTYVVQLAGFPRPDALRAEDGSLLARSLSYRFHTVAREEGVQLFGDNHPDRTGRLMLITEDIEPDAPIVLLCREEAIDPTSLRDGQFGLKIGNVRVPLRPRLVDRVREERILDSYLHLLEPVEPGWRGVDARSSALLELAPTESLPPGKYDLASVEQPGPTDYSGNEIRLASDEYTGYIVERDDIQRGVHHESFTGSGMRTPLAVEGADGTAHWSSTGRVEISYPAAAGTGADGEVVLAGREDRADVHATRISLAQGAVCSLSEGLSTVVLRAQGTMRISGRLERLVAKTPEEIRTLCRGEGTGRFPEEGDPGALAPANAPFHGSGSLSGWLRRLLDEDLPWTVLIAGADLVIDGEVETNAPILLVAGGLVRISGDIRSRLAWSRVFLLGEGGGRSFVPDVESTRTGLVIDPPDENPLRMPLKYAVVSGPIPRHGEVRRWLGSEVGGHAGNGELFVRYLDEDLPLDGSDWRPVVDPRLLDGAPPVRLLIELVVPAADPGTPAGLRWDPPYVDYVHLSWD